MSDRRKPFPFDEFEPKWQSRWESEKTFRTPGPGDEGFDASKPKYYVLDMFPYPSGAGLHVGHPEGYTATDIIGRYKRKNGFNVLHPMGYDAFGLPAEEHARATGEHPAINTANNIANFRRQLKSLGFAYDWEREIATTDPEYVRWTQWIFLQLYSSYFDEESGKAKNVSELEAKGWTREQIDEVRLAYVANTPVWWSPTLGTVLANEEVEEWKGKNHVVERRPLRQWMLRITKYAQRLIDELDTLDWPDGIKLLQKNWIGRSEGAEVKFDVGGREVVVFTTRPDTLFGATYMVLAPEHPFVPEITTADQKEAVEAYQKAISSKSDLDRGDLNKDKSGVFTGAYATNPVNGEKIPVWIADYVMMGYGTGAIMAVPAHDERDFEFATKFSLPVIQVVQPSDDSDWQGYTAHGTAVNSGFLDGLPTAEAKAKMIVWLGENGKGTKRVQFKLRDWLFSRQRYWGEPFPITWKDGNHHAIPESELPLLAPPLEDYKPSGTPDPLLSKATAWVELPDGSLRETNTMPQWAGSCWYYLRYCDPGNTDRFISKEAEDYWTDDKPGMVDLYVGGTEHAVLHLLYARFWHKVLFDLGHVRTPEPFQKLVNQGLILGEDGQKMSKSRGNVVNPDDVVKEYGADALRLYEMFMGPLEQVKPWQMKGVEGVARFLARVWRVAFEETAEGGWNVSPKIQDVPCTDKELLRVVHETIKKVGEDIEKLSFNTAISQMMICTNAFTQVEVVPLKEFTQFLTVLDPFAPHLAEEINARLGSTAQLSELPWPAYDPEALVRNEIEIVVQVNGKLRDRLSVSKDADEEAVKAVAFESAKVKEHLDGKTIRKVIYVPGKILNVVVG
ncbi:leucine--tRNA ligase [Luteolibacter sp. SL250]|uniref:leucine--tRNA ligase n=1 Tax=Luteolibacter sp. SL250 TaxID=2995170 RepID=UPI002270A3FC|nr:leucine--tRNA ligase [Luteolibacter sp. SL250]WAC20292.1 leucine--tRNA ligase [Luteolibacter sp. SL250]